MSTNARKGNWMISFRGERIYPLDMRPEDVHIEDIASALSKICRFGGHCTSFYSVAQHSCLVAARCSPENQRVALLHDATEAYCGDVVRPLKQHLAGYAEIEAGIWRAIATRFDLPEELPEEVLVEDARVLLMEKRELLAQHDHEWAFPQCAYPDLEVPRDRIYPRDPVDARLLFSRVYRDLFGEGAGL